MNDIENIYSDDIYVVAFIIRNVKTNTLRREYLMPWDSSHDSLELSTWMIDAYIFNSCDEAERAYNINKSQIDSIRIEEDCCIDMIFVYKLFPPMLSKVLYNKEDDHGRNII